MNMNEYVLVEFLAVGDDRQIIKDKLMALSYDFIPIKYDDEYDIDYDVGEIISYARYSGKISAEYASIIKMQDPFLSERMRISYIPDELKNYYRNLK